jgi:hypothetical protein
MALDIRMFMVCFALELFVLKPQNVANAIVRRYRTCVSKVRKSHLQTIHFEQNIETSYPGIAGVRSVTKGMKLRCT